MRNSILKIVLILLIAATVNLFGDQYHSNKLYLKVKDADKKNIIQSDFLNSLNTDKGLDFSVSPLINFQIPRKYKNNSLQKVNSQFEELSKIRIIEFNRNIDPVKFAKILSGNDNIIYAEPVPKSYIIEGETNDPDLEELYHLYKVQAFEAWKQIDGDSVTIGIVDTGIDFEHEDLKNVIWTNPGETGLDDNGNDKATNGIDDDGNGYVDDWRGWDFKAGESEDNNPTYGNNHGVHVSGIAAAEVNNGVGVAGMYPKARILPIKVGSDFGFDNSVYNEYQGLLYAAMMGADVINCSWGSGSFSKTHQEIVNTASEMGALIIGAAGNNNSDMKFYPASYSNVVSVASTQIYDGKSGFSNYNFAVDISAPGSSIYSTIPDSNKYAKKSGTSMAAPVVSGAAAALISKFPELSPIQIKELLKVNSDDIDSLNRHVENKIGEGRLNLLKAVNQKNRISIILNKYELKRNGSSDAIFPGENLEIELEILNVLDPVENINVSIINKSEFPLEINNNNFTKSNVSSLSSFTQPGKINFNIPEDVPVDYTFTIEIKITSDEGFEYSRFIEFKVNPSFLNITGKEITTTVNSIGNLAFNNYPDNDEGVGLLYKGLSNILFESSFMAAAKDSTYVSDVARGSKQSEKDLDFSLLEKIEVHKENDHEMAVGRFNDYVDSIPAFEDSTSIGIEVKQQIYAFKDAELENALLLNYTVINKSGSDIDSIYFGNFYDWDLSDGGAADSIYFDPNMQSGIVEDKLNDNSPIVAVNQLSNQILNFYAIDNPESDGVGIYNGFTEKEKYITLTSELGNRSSKRNDASMVLGAGPIYLKEGDSVNVVFSINLNSSKELLKNDIDNIRRKAIELGFILDENSENKVTIDNIYPNPVNKGSELFIGLNSEKTELISAKIIDIRGRKILEITDLYLRPGYNKKSIELNGVYSGVYFLELTSQSGIEQIPFVVIGE